MYYSLSPRAVTNTLFVKARRFAKLGLKAAPVNGEVYDMVLHQVRLHDLAQVISTDIQQDLAAKKYRVLITSPEMCLEHVLFSKLVQSPEFMRHVLYLVVDEAHCISQWGDSFRKKFGELSKMRSFVGMRKSFLLTSATLPPFMLTEVFMKVEFSESTTYIVNLGNDRDNITPIVHRLKAARSSLPILDFLIRDVRPGHKLPRAIIFFNSRDLTHTAYRYLRGAVIEEMQDEVEFLHAGRGQRARRRVMRRFREGTVSILCATEAAGMVSLTTTTRLTLH